MSHADFSKYWLCPKDGSKMVEFIKRNDSGVFQILRHKLDLSISNAIAVRKITKEQYEETKELALILLEKLDTPAVTVVSVICPICNYRSIAPQISGLEIDSNKVRKKQYKTVSEITKQAEKKRNKISSSQSGSRFPIFYLFFIIPTIIAFVLGTLAFFGISLEKILEILNL